MPALSLEPLPSPGPLSSLEVVDDAFLPPSPLPLAAGTSAAGGLSPTLVVVLTVAIFACGILGLPVDHPLRATLRSVVARLVGGEARLDAFRRATCAPCRLGRQRMSERVGEEAVARLEGRASGACSGLLQLAEAVGVACDALGSCLYAAVGRQVSKRRSGHGIVSTQDDDENEDEDEDGGGGNDDGDEDDDARGEDEEGEGADITADDLDEADDDERRADDAAPASHAVRSLAAAYDPEEEAAASQSHARGAPALQLCMRSVLSAPH